MRMVLFLGAMGGVCWGRWAKGKGGAMRGRRVVWGRRRRMRGVEICVCGGAVGGRCMGDEGRGGGGGNECVGGANWRATLAAPREPATRSGARAHTDSTPGPQREGHPYKRANTPTRNANATPLKTRGSAPDRGLDA